MKLSYLYIYVDPTKPGKYTYPGIEMSFLFEPIYVGKGAGGRMYDHINQSLRKRKSAKHLAILNCIDAGFNMRDYIIKCFVTPSEEEVYAKEIKYIEAIGRKSKKLGPLTNVSAGGTGARLGQLRRLSEEALLEIQYLHSVGATIKDLSEHFGVCLPTIQNALDKLGIAWRRVSIYKHLEQEICEKYTAGATARQLEKEYGIVNTLILRIVKKAGGTTRKRNVKLENLSEESKEEIVRRHLDGETNDAIAKDFGVYDTSILWFLRKRGYGSEYSGTAKSKSKFVA